MSQWNQPGYQYPLQTGFPGQSQGFQPNPQQQQQFQPGPNLQFQQQPGIQQLPGLQQQGGFGGAVGGFSGGMSAGFAPQPTAYPGTAPAPGGFGGVGHSVVPQPTGFPVTAPTVPWSLSKEEKKHYDQIFRAWDHHGTGFISGQAALEVFGQSGLDKNDLARIWTLADTDNRGKLNLAEFHVAMGLIYRRLHGNDIPDKLPPELVPPSSRDLDTSVNFLKDILKNDTRSRTPSSADTPVSRLRDRSLHSTSVPGAGGRQDATVYKHADIQPPGGIYQSRSRHIDRNNIRSRNDDDSPAADLSEMKRQLENTAKMLDQAAEADASRTAEDDTLDREMGDLRYSIKRLQDDLEYVSRGPRSVAKDEERRRLERELLKLMHQRLPEMERKIEDRQARRDRQKREWTRERDRRNDRHGHYDDNDNEGRYTPSRRYHGEDEDRDRGYGRGGRYGGEDRDSAPDRSYPPEGRERSRPRSPLATAARSPPPLPPAAAPQSAISKPPPPPAPVRSPAPASKNMTHEERQAFIRAEAKRRLEARMQALGVGAASVSSPTLDTSVEDRLAQEKREAEEKAKEAERQAELREKQRKERLDNEKAAKEGRTTPAPPSAPPIPAERTPAPHPAPIAKVTLPPPPKSRGPAPPPPRKGAPRPPVGIPEPGPLAPPASHAPVSAPTSRPSTPPVIRAPVPSVPEVDPEDEALKAREAVLRQRREERAALMRKLEEEEEEARRAEEAYKARRNQFLATKAPSPTPTPPVVSSPAPPPPPVVQAPEPEEFTPTAPSAPPPPPPPPALSAVSGEKASTNPFSRLMKEGGASTMSMPTATPATNGGSNPFFRSQTAPPPTAPTPPVKASYHTAPSNSEDEWDDVKERDDDDSSDDEFESRDTRKNLAQQLFGSILPPARPQSAGPAPQSTSSPTPAAPPPPAASLAPAAPPAPAIGIAAPTPTGDRSSLLSSIQGGARLRKTVTNDRSAAPLSGKVLGDVAPPAHINITPRPVSPPSLPEPPVTSHDDFSHSRVQSVDWYAGLAADHGAEHHLPATVEEEEEEDVDEYKSPVPDIQVSEHFSGAAADSLDDVDKSTEFYVRSLYAYEGQRAEDLSFHEHLILTAHPSKSGGDWWYGTVVKDRRSGFFPQTYVQVVEKLKATAIYSYDGSNADELSFTEGDELSIVDKSEADWWKAERGGVVFIVPAAYLEVVEG